MNMKDAVSADRSGHAEVKDAGGRLMASVYGPGSWLSARKQKKRWKRVAVTYYTPPLADPGGTYTAPVKVSRMRLPDFPPKVRTWLETLNWQPCEAVSAIDRLGSVIGKMKPPDPLPRPIS